MRHYEYLGHGFKTLATIFLKYLRTIRAVLLNKSVHLVKKAN